MALLRSVLTFVVVGTLFGVVAGTLSGPTVVMGDLCGFSKDASNIRPCSDTVEKATAAVIRYQLYGAGGGAVLGLVVGIAWSLRKKKPAADPAPRA